jgi:hypothetical protein
MNTLLKIAALAAVLAPPAAFAEDYPSSPSQPGMSGSGSQSMDYTKLDTNGDGKISKDEAATDPTLSSNFSKLDKDKDGTLSSTELSAAKTK